MKLCSCNKECERWGVFEDGTGGYFCPYNPFSDTVCKKTVQDQGDTIKPKIIKNVLDG
jgi:hypothetical protein